MSILSPVVRPVLGPVVSAPVDIRRLLPLLLTEEGQPILTEASQAIQTEPASA